MSSVYLRRFLFAICLVSGGIVFSSGCGGGSGGSADVNPGTTGTVVSCNTEGCDVSCNTASCSATCTANNCTSTCTAANCTSTCTGSSCTSSCVGDSCRSTANGSESRSSSSGSASRSSSDGARSASECSGASCGSTASGDLSDSRATGTGSTATCSGNDCSQEVSETRSTTTLPPLDPADPTLPAIIANVDRLFELTFYALRFNDTQIDSGGSDHICTPGETFLTSGNCIAYVGLGESGYSCGNFPSIRLSADANAAVRAAYADYDMILEAQGGGDVDPRNGQPLVGCEHHSDDGPSHCSNYQVILPRVQFTTRNITNIDLTCCHLGEGRPSSSGDLCASLLGAQFPADFDISAYRRSTIPADAAISSSSFSIPVTSASSGGEDVTTWNPDSLNGEFILCKAVGRNVGTGRTADLNFFKIGFERNEGLCDEPDLYDYVDTDHPGPDGVDVNRFYENR